MADPSWIEDCPPVLRDRMSVWATTLARASLLAAPGSGRFTVSRLPLQAVGSSSAGFRPPSGWLDSRNPQPEPVGSVADDGAAHAGTGDFAAAPPIQCSFDRKQQGVLSCCTVLTHEDPVEYRALLKALTEKHRPVVEAEAHLVGEFAGII